MSREGLKKNEPKPYSDEAILKSADKLPQPPVARNSPHSPRETIFSAQDEAEKRNKQKAAEQTIINRIKSIFNRSEPVRIADVLHEEALQENRSFDRDLAQKRIEEEALERARDKKDQELNDEIEMEIIEEGGDSEDQEEITRRKEKRILDALESKLNKMGGVELTPILHEAEDLFRIKFVAGAHPDSEYFKNNVWSEEAIQKLEDSSNEPGPEVDRFIKVLNLDPHLRLSPRMKTHVVVNTIKRLQEESDRVAAAFGNY